MERQVNRFCSSSVISSVTSLEHRAEKIETLETWTLFLCLNYAAMWTFQSRNAETLRHAMVV